MCENFRAAVKADIDGVRRCAERAYGIYVERIGRKPAPMIADFEDLLARGALFVCEIDAAVVGFVVYRAQGDFLLLENVAVDPGFHGRGIGGRLIAQAETEGRALGLDRIELYTNAKMTENLALYAYLGYEPFDRRNEDGFDRIYFRKQL